MLNRSVRHAIIIGINKYKHSKEIPELQFACNDAQELRGVLTNQSAASFPVENITYLIDDEATRENIIEAFSHVQKNAKENDIVLFYFAGHGSSAQANTVTSFTDDAYNKYILPWDAEPKKLASKAIDFETLHNHFHRIQSRSLMMVFDCCHSGAGGRTYIPSAHRNSEGQGNPIGTGYIDALAQGSGRLVLAACTGNQLAYECTERKHGLFTHYILDGIKGNADYDNDGFVELYELWSHVVSGMRNDPLLKSQDWQQTPVMSGRLEGGSIILGHTQKPTEYSLDDRKRIEISLVQKYGLQRVRMANCDSTDSIAEEAAKYLDETLSHNQKIAVSCGKTLVKTVSLLKPKNLANVTIYPLNGSPTPEVHITDSMVLTYLLWSKFETGNTSAKVIPTGIPEDLVVTIKDRLTEIATNMLDQAKGSHTFLFGIGNPKENDNIKYILEKAGLKDTELEKMGVAGEINFHLYDHNGNFLLLNETLPEKQQEVVKLYNSRFFSIHAKDILSLKETAADVVAVAGGRTKLEAIRGALRGGYVTTLITDINSAAWLEKHF